MFTNVSWAAHSITPIHSPSSSTGRRQDYFVLGLEMEFVGCAVSVCNTVNSVWGKKQKNHTNKTNKTTKKAPPRLLQRACLFFVNYINIQCWWVIFPFSPYSLYLN